LKGISFDIEKSKIVSIIGASGAGKTTLLHILGTLEKPDKGKILLDNKSIFDLKNNDLATFRNKKIGFVFQFHHLLPEFSALENVMIPAQIENELSKKEIKNYAEFLLNKMQLSHRYHHKPSQLSGGEQQRVAIARALMNKPALILADEPTGNLDTKTSQEIVELMFSLREEFQQTFILVTHNNDIAKASDNILHLQDGKLIND
ncbi:MAG: ABC transporter ATP-binding protein, partial [Chitinophagaceae bacterium]|nr:ABC transporter ATP-binding protein [Chitinophagaceae bacterium]